MTNILPTTPDEASKIYTEAALSAVQDLIGHVDMLNASLEKREVAFNINEYVKVKLTARGLKIHKSEYTRFMPSDWVYVKPSVDENGYSKFQMWNLMSIFGEHISMTLEPPFETEIIFCVGS